MDSRDPCGGEQHYCGIITVELWRSGPDAKRALQGPGTTYEFVKLKGPSKEGLLSLGWEDSLREHRFAAPFPSHSNEITDQGKHKPSKAA
jgi:hypothetical protein